MLSRGSGSVITSSAEGREIVCTSTYYSVRAQCVWQYQDIVRVSQSCVDISTDTVARARIATVGISQSCMAMSTVLGARRVNVSIFKSRVDIHSVCGARKANR